jgi:hypothetical protein
VAAAVELLADDQRPTLPVVVVDTAKVTKVVARFADGNCGFVLQPNPTAIFVNATCPYVKEGLRPSPRPIAIAAVAALLAHEQAHVNGADEAAARRVELKTFRRVVMQLRREREPDAMRHATELERRVRDPT